MPNVTIQMLEGSFSPEEHTALISGITDAFVKIAGEGIRPVVVIAISEIRSGLWATGGTPLTIEEVRARREARQRAAAASSLPAPGEA